MIRRVLFFSVWIPMLGSVVVNEKDADKSTCKDPGHVANAQRLNSDGSPSFGLQRYRFGESVLYTCNPGYELQRRSMITCQSSGLWSYRTPYCRRAAPTSSINARAPTPRPDTSGMKFCRDPGVDPNGIRLPKTPPSRRGFPQGSSVEYSCTSDQMLSGERSLFCTTSGDWSASRPKCIPQPEKVVEVQSCEMPEAINNGRMQYYSPGSRVGPGSPNVDYDLEEYPEGTVVEYFCDEGYSIQGSYSLKCEPSGRWSDNTPSCVADCGKSFILATRRVFTGEKTIAGEWPWVVSISAVNDKGSVYICGGAVLDDHTVITAAHCMVNGPAGYILRFGKHHFKIEEDEEDVLIRKTNKVIVHPDYTRSGTSLDSDIALMTFKPRIRFSVSVQPLCLPTSESTFKNIKTGRLGYVSGWGLTESATVPDVMKLASLPVVTNEVCQEAYTERNILINDNMFCAGYEDSRQNVCGGDSGSPLVFYDVDLDRYTLEGLVSFAPRGQCGRAGKYAIFTKVYRFLGWIYKNL